MYIRVLCVCVCCAVLCCTYLYVILLCIRLCWIIACTYAFWLAFYEINKKKLLEAKIMYINNNNTYAFKR